MAENDKIHRVVGDKLINLASSLGTDKDKASFFNFYFQELDAGVLSNMYRGDWISRKAVDIPAEDETREWRAWKADAVKKTSKKAKQPGSDEDGAEARKKGARKFGDRLPLPEPGETDRLEGEATQIELLEAEEKRLDVQGKVLKARKLARLYGGAVIIIGTGGDASKELKPENVKKGDLKYLLVLNRWEITAGEMDLDLSQPTFGLPKYYELRGVKTEVKIHPSRVLRFIGNERSEPYMQSGDGWGDSILQSVQDAVKQAASAPQIVNSLLSEAKVDIVGIKNLALQLSTPDGEAKVKNRMRVSDLLKSTINAVVHDADGETYEQKTINFSQFPELINAFLQIASGAVDVPAARFLSTSPKGMNATGDSDFRQYYDTIKATQKNKLAPLLAPLDEMLIRSALGDRPPEIWYEWNPLWQMSEAERAEINAKNAETAKKYLEMRVIPTDAISQGIANMLVESGFLPGLEQLIAESETSVADFAISEEEAAAEEEAAMAQAQREALAAKARPVGDSSAPRTLYVRRDVLNGAEILKWARAQGFGKTLAASDLHVTITYSKTPLDWLKVAPEYGMDDSGKLVVQPGGPRVIEPLGDEGAVVLKFRNWRLEGRHKEILEAGATSDYPEYQPHVTITYEPGGVDLSKVEPYTGKIVLGPEIFEEVVPGGFRPFDFRDSSPEAMAELRRRLDAYNPNQPRDPAGSETGGQWSSEVGPMSEAKQAEYDKKAREEVLAKGKENGTENIAAYDKNNGVWIKDPMESATRASAKMSPGLSALSKDPANAIVLHHNHPSEASLSSQDLLVLAGRPGLARIVAHGPAGGVYSASLLPSFDKLSFKRTLESFHDKIQGLIDMGEVKVADANDGAAHLLNKQLAAMRFISYDYKLAKSTAEVVRRVEKAIADNDDVG